ncbi:ABC transporter substrate-binding protein [Magnetovibrio sp. PR-2]|uniref:ABC transporter substrate-binding protein n=1 Tax=Magnetovibrio sp. PR-2 TaxID=3120356 RepID=UPI002FCE329D
MTEGSTPNAQSFRHQRCWGEILNKLLIIALFWALGMAAPAQALDIASGGPAKVTLQLKWKHQFQFAGYYMAKELGYYADAGLNVEIREAKPGLEPIHEVIEERAHFGVGTSDLILMRDQGHPVVVLGTIFQHSPLAVMVRMDSGITNIHQLASSTLMIEPHSAELMAAFATEGIDTHNLNIVEHTFNVGQLLDERVDGMSVYTTDEPYIMEQVREDYLLLRPISSGIDFYGDNLFTTEHMVTDHPEQVKAFWEASKKGWTYALNNMDKTIDHILKTYPTIKDREHLAYEAGRTRDLILPDIVEVGYMTPARWTAIANTYKELGLISQDFDISGLLFEAKPNALPSWFWDAFIVGVLTLAAGLVALAYQTTMNRRLRQKECQLTQANQHKEMLLSIIGHDLKNPIYAIRNYGDKIALNPEAITPKELSQYGHMISFGIDTAMGVLDNLQQWSVLQSGDLDTENVPVDMHPIIKRNLDLFRLQAESENIQMSASGFESIKVLGNEWRIDTVVRNLISNAYKNTPSAGSITLSVQSTSEHHEIIIEDTGTGMTEETFSIFKLPDGQALMDANRTGSGFGLPLCKRLVELHGGELSLENNPAGGLRVTLRLLRA